MPLCLSSRLCASVPLCLCAFVSFLAQTRNPGIPRKSHAWHRPGTQYAFVPFFPPLFLCASLPLCLSSPLCAFVPLCLSSFVSFLAQTRNPGNPRKSHSSHRPGIQYAFPPQCLCAFLPPPFVPLFLCVIPGPDQESRETKKVSFLGTDQEPRESTRNPVSLCAFLPPFVPLCLCASLCRE